MKITFLGSGTSAGVPSIGCRCDVCCSGDTKNIRLRSSILIEHSNNNILVDTATDLRMQVLANNVRNINVVLYTHAHADHIHGIDELRSFNYIQKQRIPCYGSKETIDKIRNMFSYIFSNDDEEMKGGFRPMLDVNIISSSFTLFDLKITPIKIFHGKMEITGYRFDDVAYITDCSYIPGESMKALKGLDILILDALRFNPHPTHFSLDQAVEVARELKAKRVIFTHLTHHFDYNKVNEELPDHMELAYDGMVINI